jgi:hypothetical protein
MAPPNSNNGGSSKVFGQAMKKSKRSSGSNYQRQFGGKGNNKNKKNNDTVYRSADATSDSNANNDSKAAELAQWRRMKQAKGEALDKAFGTERFAPLNQTTTIVTKAASKEPEQEQSRRGWLYNILPTTVRSSFFFHFFPILKEFQERESHALVVVVMSLFLSLSFIYTYFIGDTIE